MRNIVLKETFSIKSVLMKNKNNWKNKKLSIGNGHPVVISVMGVCQGCGTTHTAVALSNYCANALGYKTAVLELNDNNDFMKIRRMAEYKDDSIYTFAINNVDFYAKADTKCIENIFEKDYDVIIMDISYVKAKESTEVMIEFDRSDIKLVIVSMDMWKYYEVKEFLINKSDCISKMNILSLSYNKEMAEIIKKEMNISIQNLIYEPDPMNIPSEHLMWYKKQLQFIHETDY